MVKLIMKTFIFLVIFFSAIYVIGLQENYFDLKKAENIVPLEIFPKPEPEPEPEIVVSGMELQPGGCFQIYLKGLTDRDEIKVSTLLVLEQPVFYGYKEGKVALVPVNCRTKEGDYSYKVQVFRDGEVKTEKEEILKILPKEFEKQYLNVSTKQAAQRSEENFDQDQIYTDKAKSATSDKPLWEGVFIKPVDGRISTEFGMIRYVNKKESGRHSGLDLAAAKGTPVKAANSGTVRLSMLLKVTGNTVILDHGLSIYSSYAHLDKLLVKEGDQVKKGDIIGEVGSTGFSTGPHLHWTTTIGKVYINPESLMAKDPLGFLDAAGSSGQ